MANSSNGKRKESFFESTNVAQLKTSDFVSIKGALAPSLRNGAILFYAPWCYWCNVVKSDYIQFADEMKRIDAQFTVAAVDCDKNKEVASKFKIDANDASKEAGVEGFPTIIFYFDGKGIEYTEKRDKESMIAFYKKMASAKNQQAKGALNQKNGGAKKGAVAKAAPVASSQAGFFSGGSVYELSAQNFDIKAGALLGMQTPAVVLFYAPWCHWCQEVKPEWVKLSNSGSSIGFTVAAIDCTQNPVIADALNVRGYPTIMFFPTEDMASGIVYHDTRTAEAVRAFVEDNVSAASRQLKDNIAIRKNGPKQNEVNPKKVVSPTGGAQPLLVMFYDDDALAKRVRDSVLSKLAHKFQRYLRIGILRRQDYPDLARKAGITSSPTFVLFVNGKTYKYIGPVDQEPMSEFLYQRVVYGSE